LVRSEAPTAAILKTTLVWDVTTFNAVDVLASHSPEEMSPCYCACMFHLHQARHMLCSCYLPLFHHPNNIRRWLAYRLLRYLLWIFSKLRLTS